MGTPQALLYTIDYTRRRWVLIGCGVLLNVQAILLLLYFELLLSPLSALHYLVITVQDILHLPKYA